MQNYSLILILLSVICCNKTQASKIQYKKIKTDYSTITFNQQGFIFSITDSNTQKEYCPKGISSALLTLEKNGGYLVPVSAKIESQNIELTYPNGSVAKLKVEPKGNYIRFELVSLSHRDSIDNIIWGPYKTNISKTIGEIISVVRDDEFAIGIIGLTDNTISGPPCNGDMYQQCYIVHSPDPSKYPLPANLKEGQRFRIGGDGKSDIAFFSQPEEYYRMIMGNGAQLELEYGSSIVMHSRDRMKPFSILYPHFEDFPSVKSPRHMDVAPVDADYIGSAIAFYACPDDWGLKVIEKIVLGEGLPYITKNGKWVKDPSSFQTDMAWWGAHDSLVSYAKQLGIKGVQDEGLGEYYVDPSDRWAGKKVKLNGQDRPITELTAQANKYGIAYGLHTLAEFVQPHSSDVHPEPNEQLCTVMKTSIIAPISASDTTISIADLGYLNEQGGWDNNESGNTLRIGKELIRYKRVTKTQPYTLIGVERGALKTVASKHEAGEEIARLQVNCYSGFIPDMKLQDKYADFYARLLTDGGMNYIDFDGFESCTYQGHGQYSFKRFMHKLFTDFHQMGGEYLRVMGSCVYEGNWHYMSVCNVGGGNHMFDPVNNKWGIEGKDIRYAWTSNYFPCTFGIQLFKPDWTVQVIENLQSKAIAWDATYMLGLSHDVVEKNPQKQAIFKTFRAWEDARAANVFPVELKKQMQAEENMYHLEQVNSKTWKLYRVLDSGNMERPVILKSTDKKAPF